MQRVDLGESAEKAIHDASMDRFRPILMTTLAAVFGAIPIALGFGADGASRRPLGLVIVGGLIVSQFITLFITPVIYLYLEEFQEKVLNRTSFFRSEHRPPPSQARFAALNVMIRLARAPRQSRAKNQIRADSSVAAIASRRFRACLALFQWKL